VNVSTQVFVIPAGETIVAATFSGTFGLTSVFNGSSAHANLLLDGNVILDSNTLSPSVFTNVVPFSVSLGATSFLNDASVTLSYVQTTQTNVRLSATTLQITTRATGNVPDAGSALAIFGVALASLLAVRRRMVS
jgi:hypothetical protein